MDANVYEREKLYNEVWSEPVTIVAKRYGVSDVMIHKICKRLKIPVPPRGYWARVRAGAKLQKAPLPQYNGPSKIWGSRSEAPSSDEGETTGTKKMPLSYLEEAERQKILDTCSMIEIKDQLRRLHSLIIEHREEMVARRKRERERKRYDFYGIRFSGNRSVKEEPDKKVISVRVTGEAINRAYRLLDALFRALKELDCRVMVDDRDGKTYAVVRGEKIEFSMVESNGLGLVLENSRAERKNFRDTKTKILDALIGPFIIEMFETAERVRVAREAWELEQKRREEEARRRRLRAELQEEEMKKVERLQNAAMDWNIARIIRGYIETVEQQMDTFDEKKQEQAVEWISWAKDKADWFDPTRAREDAVLGKRKHGLPEGKKVELENPYSFFR